MIIPSTLRESRLEQLLAVLVPQMPDGGQTLVVFDLEDARERANLVSELMDRHPEVEFVFSHRKGCWNATKVGLSMAEHEFVGWTADDAMPQPDALVRGIGQFRYGYHNGMGLLVFEDLQNGGAVAGHALTTKQFLRCMFGGELLPEGFRHLYLDTLIADRARDLGRLYYAKTIIFEHKHWRTGKSERDALNERNEIGEIRLADKARKDELDREWMAGGRRKAIQCLAGRP